MNIYYVYILASQSNGKLYIGVTDDIERRVYEHKNKIIHESFTNKYNISILVYYEEFNDIVNDIVKVIHIEKCIKKRNRSCKLNLIEKTNPTWRDLYEDFLVN